MKKFEFWSTLNIVEPLNKDPHKLSHKTASKKERTQSHFTRAPSFPQGIGIMWPDHVLWAIFIRKIRPNFTKIG